MDFYKNSEIADELNVSNTAVMRWVENARLGKNNLFIKEVKGKFKIIKSQHNKAELLRLREEGFRFRRHQDFAKVYPSKEFYDTFSEEQVVEIANTLELQKSINHKFSYLNRGAHAWDAFYIENVEKGMYPTAQRVINLLKKNLDYILYRCQNFEKINIIDIGPGNAYPVKDFVGEIMRIGKLNKYITIDIGAEVNEVAITNIKKWYPDLEPKSYIMDVEHSNFIKAFYENKLSNGNKILNLILYIGGTIGNNPDEIKVLKNFSDAMDRNDLLIVSNTIDSLKNRSEMGYTRSEEIYRRTEWIPKLIGFDFDTCEKVGRYESVEVGKTLKLRLDKDYEVVFEIFGTEKSISLFKGEEITIWNHHMTDLTTLIPKLETAQLQLVHLSTEVDLTHVLAVCQAKS